MEMVNLFLPSTNRFATDYSTGEASLQSLFHYNFSQEDSYVHRAQELQSRHFRREELADYIQQYMKKFPTSDEVEQSLQKLRQPESLVVIGGQQAGILTGPLYSIHKIISIIQLAKRQEQELQVPVIPVFWIAGEDHDYDEVNHIFLEKNDQLTKVTYPERILDKRMVTHIPVTEEKLRQWVDEIFASFGETAYTNDILSFTNEAIAHSKSFVEFFAHIVMQLFKKYGLLIVDSGDRGIRKLEKEFLIELIINAEEITSSVKNKQDELAKKGFNNTITISDSCANLFYYDETKHERILLEYDPATNIFSAKEGQVTFSREELLEIASEFPERLSNNVVTRPLMQEWLFPSLAFIAGPGEIAYWAELKNAFEHFNMQMPPIVPRLNITVLERNISSDIQELSLDIQDVLVNGTHYKKEQFLNEHRDVNYSDIFGLTKKQLTGNYEELRKRMEMEYPGLLPLLEKNGDFLLSQIEFMEKKVEKALQDKHSVVLRKYERIERKLKPNGAPQERIWNIFYYLNSCGLSFIDELMDLPFVFNGSHQLVKI